MKNTLNKLDFHYTYIIIALGFVLTGYFTNLIAFTSLILFHELGHIICMYHYGFKIEKITIYPFGGFIKTNNIIDQNIDEELIIAIMGVFSQTCFYIVISFFISNKNLNKLYIFNNIYSIFNNNANSRNK